MTPDPRAQLSEAASGLGLFLGSRAARPAGPSPVGARPRLCWGLCETQTPLSASICACHPVGDQQGDLPLQTSRPRQRLFRGMKPGGQMTSWSLPVFHRGTAWGAGERVWKRSWDLKRGRAYLLVGELQELDSCPPTEDVLQVPHVLWDTLAMSRSHRKLHR